GAARRRPAASHGGRVGRVDAAPGEPGAEAGREDERALDHDARRSCTNMEIRRDFRADGNIRADARHCSVMTVPRLFAIALIFLCTTCAWFILGASVNARTDEFDPRLRGEVEKLWGGKHVQPAPTAWYETTRVVPREVKEDVNGATITKTIQETVVDKTPVPLTMGRVDVALGLDERQKGLLWYA